MDQTNKTQTDTNFNYYHEYFLMSQMRELVNQRNQLSTKFDKLEKKGEEIQDGQKSQDQRQKRFRRTANQIERHYRCSVQTCQRSYGSEGSLNQHLKLKHYQLYQKLNINRISQKGDQQEQLDYISQENTIKKSLSKN